jgi:hypothetical protein
MADTHSPVLVRMTNELKGQLQREAAIHARTLTGEINERLKASLQPPSPASYSGPHLVTRIPINDKSPDDLTETDRALLQIFRAMPYDKQLALLSLLK